MCQTIPVAHHDGSTVQNEKPTSEGRRKEKKTERRGKRKRERLGRPSKVAGGPWWWYARRVN